LTLPQGRPASQPPLGQVALLTDEQIRPKQQWVGRVKDGVWSHEGLGLSASVPAGFSLVDNPAALFIFARAQPSPAQVIGSVIKNTEDERNTFIKSFTASFRTGSGLDLVAEKADDALVSIAGTQVPESRWAIKGGKGRLKILFVPVCDSKVTVAVATFTPEPQTETLLDAWRGSLQRVGPDPAPACGPPRAPEGQ
jgi:hypothetical protein